MLLGRIFSSVRYFATVRRAMGTARVINYVGAEIDHEVAMKIKEVLALDRPFVKKAAWLGTEHIPHALTETFHIFSQRETATFETREEALEWLVRE